MKNIVIISMMILVGCQSVPEPQGSYELVDAETGIIALSDGARIARATCLIEKNKIPVPTIPSSESDCGAKSDQYSPGFAGFLAGACASNNLREREQARVAVKKAMAERSEVYDACLLVNGLKQVWIPSEPAD